MQHLHKWGCWDCLGLHWLDSVPRLLLTAQHTITGGWRKSCSSNPPARCHSLCWYTKSRIILYQVTEYYAKLKYLRRHKSYFIAIFRSTQNYLYNKRIMLSDLFLPWTILSLLQLHPCIIKLLRIFVVFLNNSYNFPCFLLISPP